MEKLTTGDIARITGKNKRTVLNWIKNGKLKSIVDDETGFNYVLEDHFYTVFPEYYRSSDVVKVDRNELSKLRKEIEELSKKLIQKEAIINAKDEHLSDLKESHKNATVAFEKTLALLEHQKNEAEEQKKKKKGLFSRLFR